MNPAKQTNRQKKAQLTRARAEKQLTKGADYTLECYTKHANKHVRDRAALILLREMLRRAYASLSLPADERAKLATDTIQIDIPGIEPGTSSGEFTSPDGFLTDDTIIVKDGQTFRFPRPT